MFFGWIYKSKLLQKVSRQMWHKPGNAAGKAFKVDDGEPVYKTLLYPPISTISGYKNGEYYAFFFVRLLVRFWYIYQRCCSTYKYSNINKVVTFPAKLFIPYETVQNIDRRKAFRIPLCVNKIYTRTYEMYGNTFTIAGKMLTWAYMHSIFCVF